MPKIIDIKLGEELVIRHKRRRGGGATSGEGTGQKKAPLPADWPPPFKYISSKKGQITLYDLAIRMLDGVETPIPQFIRWTNYNTPPVLSQPDRAALDAALLAGDFRQSRQLDFDPSPHPAIPTGVSIASDELAETFDFVEVGGWRATPAGAGYFKHTRHVSGFYESNPRYYHNILLHSHPERYKLTATPDYTAPAVELPVIKDKSKVGVYLVPHRPTFRLVYILRFRFPDGSETTTGMFGLTRGIELATIDRIPVRPAIYDYFPSPEMAALIQEACEPAWALLYAEPEAAQLAAFQAEASNPDIVISGREQGRVIRDDERVNPGSLMGIMTINNDTFYVWSTVTTFQGTSFNAAVRSTALVHPTSWGVEPTTFSLNPFG